VFARVSEAEEDCGYEVRNKRVEVFSGGHGVQGLGGVSKDAGAWRFWRWNRLFLGFDLGWGGGTACGGQDKPIYCVDELFIQEMD
jgi:hypothetical protein